MKNTGVYGTDRGAEVGVGTSLVQMWWGGTGTEVTTGLRV